MQVLSGRTRSLRLMDSNDGGGCSERLLPFSNEPERTGQMNVGAERENPLTTANVDAMINL